MPVLAVENGGENKACNCFDGNSQYVCSVMGVMPELDPGEQSPKPCIGNPPSQFSWTDNGGDWTTPAKYQGNCGSCWDFAAVSVLESIINIREGVSRLNPDLSEQYVMSCLPASGGCRGGDPYLAFKYIMSTSSEGNYRNGIVLESCFPYEANDDVPCSAKCNDWESKLIPISDYGYWLPDGSENDRDRIKTQVMNDGPVATFMEATEEFMEWGLYNHSSEDYYGYPGPTYGINHCIAIVGWKDDPNIGNGGYWIAKNSWGTYWAHNGFFNIEYGSLNIDNYRIVWVDYDADSTDWAPVAEAGKTYHGSVGEEITFDGSDSCDAEGNIESWHWDFGDGSSSEGEKVTHSYDNRGIYTVSLNVTDEIGKQGTDRAVAFVDMWMEGDKWTYDIGEINIQMGDGTDSSLHANIGDLKITVEEGEFTLGCRGRVKGDFDVSSMPPLDFTGNLLFVIVQGVIDMDRDFGIEGIDITVRGVATVRFETAPIPLPVPFKVEINVAFDSPFYLIDFPLYTGKEWDTPPSSVAIEGAASALFGMIKMPIQYEIELGALNGKCIGTEIVNVEAGNYEAYEISYLDMIKIYFSPDTANIIKISGSYEENSIYGELKSTNYE